MDKLRAELLLTSYDMLFPPLPWRKKQLCLQFTSHPFPLSVLSCIPVSLLPHAHTYTHINTLTEAQSCKYVHWAPRWFNRDVQLRRTKSSTVKDLQQCRLWTLGTERQISLESMGLISKSLATNTHSNTVQRRASQAFKDTLKIKS